METGGLEDREVGFLEALRMMMDQTGWKKGGDLYGTCVAAHLCVGLYIYCIGKKRKKKEKQK